MTKTPSNSMPDDIMDAISRAARQVKRRASCAVDPEHRWGDTIEDYQQDIVDELAIPVGRLAQQRDDLVSAINGALHLGTMSEEAKRLLTEAIRRFESDLA